MDGTFGNQKTFEDDFSSHTPEKLTPGMLLGENQNYRLEKLLGAGTYGQAWLAAEIEGGNELRKVVCKVLPALIQKEKAEMEKVIKTFQLVQPLTHQYICPIYALKSDPICGYFFVMAYADGGTLWDWFISQPDHASGLPVSKVADVLRPVAMALDHAHAVGVVHRDVKPQNILLALRGGRKIPWLIDFGISAQIHRTVTQTIGARGRSGTPAFMAPEQCLPNQTQDGRTDQYALGVLAYLFLSGRLPFDADDPVALWGQIVYTPAPPLKNVPESVNTVVQRALAKKREERFSSCVEFINALKEPAVPKNITVPGTFATLEEACEKAPDGAVITIQPGKYELAKTIVLSRTITLRGETGKAEDVVVDCAGFDTFEITGGSPSFQNLTASNSAEPKDNLFYEGFYITGGTPQIFRCIITSRKGAGMRVKGEKADPKVESCTIKDCGGSGVIVVENGLGTFNDCEIYGNALPGIAVETSGNPTVTGCKIHDGKQNGVWVFENGLGTFNDCEIYGNAYAGIQVETSGNPTVTGCKIHDGKQGGVYILDKGMGTFNNNTLSDNYAYGILINWKIAPFGGCKVQGSGNNPELPKTFFEKLFG